MHTQIVTAQRTWNHKMQGPQCRQGPIYRTRNDPVGGQPGASLCGSHATRNATTGVQTGPRNDHDLGVCAGRRAEAEGFEPPVPLSTLAFKAQGNRVLECVPGCLSASFLLRRVPNCGACGSRLLHGCYTSWLHGNQSRSGYGPAREGLGGLAAGPVLVLAESL